MMPTATVPDSTTYDHAVILDTVNRKLQEWSRGREAISRAAWRNILYWRGHQWIIFDRQLNRWRPSRLRRQTPTPVTNKYASTMDAIISVLARVEPTLNYRPATNDPEDRATADVAIRATEVIEEEVSIRVNRQQLASWVGLTGCGWIETGYDPDERHGRRFIPHEECLMCGRVQPPAGATCAACGGALLMPAKDADSGAPLGEWAPRGKLYIDVVSLFEMYFDPSITDWKKQREFIRQKAVPLDEAKRRWPDLAESLQPDSMASAGEFYGETLPTLGPNIEETMSPRGAYANTWSGQLVNTRVTERWYWRLPDAMYPQGLLAIVVGKTRVAYAGPLPYARRDADGERTPFLPFVFFPQKLVPGSAWPKTVADDLAHKAAQRNRLESLIEMILMRTANPVWLLPEGCNVSNVTGEPGQHIRYAALGAVPGAKPERIPGQGIPAGVINFLERLDKDFEELGATFDVIKGTRPEGVSAGIALQILQERAMGRFGPLFILWEAAWSEWAQQALEIFREFATEERLRRVKGRDGAWEVEKFLGADLAGRVDVIPEAASSMPRSSLLDRAEMEQLVAIGALPPPAANPELQFKFLEVYGRTNLLPSMAHDTKRAMKENEVFEALGQDPLIGQIQPETVFGIRRAIETAANPLAALAMVEQQFAAAGVRLPRLRSMVDDHGIHAREHRELAKSERFESLPEVVQILVETHISAHDYLAAQQMQAVAAARMGTNPQAGFLSNPGGMQQPMNTSSSGRRLAGEADEMTRRMDGIPG